MDSVEPPRPVSALPDPASSRDSFLPRESKPSPQPDAGCAPAAMKELLDSDRVNYLVWRYLLEANYRETAAKFQKEWHIQEPHRHFEFAPHVQSHALVSVINRGLIYHSLERQYAQRQALERGVAAETPCGVFGPLVGQPPRKLADAEPEAEEQSNADEVDRLSRKRQIEARPQSRQEQWPGGSPPLAKKQRLSNGSENQADSATTTPMDGVDLNGQGEVENNHAYPSPTEREPAPVEIPRTDGPDQGTQVDKVEELAPETTYLRLKDEDTAAASPTDGANAPVLLHCQWNPKDPSSLAAAGTDALARVWTVTRATTGSMSNGDRPRSGHVNEVDQPCFDLVEEGTHSNAMTTALAWNWDGTAIAVASDYGFKASINIWSSAGEHLQRFELSEPPVIKLRWSPSDAAILAVGVEDGTAMVTVFRSASSVGLTYALRGHDVNSWPLDVAWINETDFLVCGGDVLQALHCTPTSIVLSRSFDTRPGDNFTQVLFDWRSKLAATASDRGVLDLWDETGQRRSISAHSSAITALAWQPLQTNPADDERLIASGSDDCSILIWNARMPENKPKAFLTMEAPIVALAFTPDGAFIAGATCNRVLIWKVGENAMPRASWSRTPHPAWLSPRAAGEGEEEDEHCLCWDATGQKLAYGVNSRLAVIDFR